MSRCKTSNWEFKNSVASSKVVLQVQRWRCKFKNSVASLEMDFRKFATEEEAVAEVGLLYIMRCKYWRKMELLRITLVAARDQIEMLLHFMTIKDRQELKRIFQRQTIAIVVLQLIYSPPTTARYFHWFKRFRTYSCICSNSYSKCVNILYLFRPGEFQAH